MRGFEDEGHFSAKKVLLSQDGRTSKNPQASAAKAERPRMEYAKNDGADDYGLAMLVNIYFMAAIC